MKKNNSNEQPNYYAILPSSVRYDNRLKPNEKLLYSEITALSNKTGLCYATNKYFADLYEVENETISRWIKHLKELQYIDVEIVYKEETKEIDKRVIKINGIHIDKNINTYIPNNQEGYCENNQEGIDKKVKENNTSINNTSINIKENIKRKVFNEIYENLGGRIRIIVSAAAPIDAKIGKWVEDIGILFLQGYGLTETAPIAALTPEFEPKVGSAGKAVT